MLCFCGVDCGVDFWIGKTRVDIFDGHVLFRCQTSLLAICMHKSQTRCRSSSRTPSISVAHPSKVLSWTDACVTDKGAQLVSSHIFGVSLDIFSPLGKCAIKFHHRYQNDNHHDSVDCSVCGDFHSPSVVCMPASAEESPGVNFSPGRWCSSLNSS